MNQGIQFAAFYWLCGALYNALCALLPTFLFITDKYTKAIEENPHARVALLKALNDTCVAWSESSHWKGLQVGSGWGVDRWLRFVAHVSFEETEKYRSPGQPRADPPMKITVYRWRVSTIPLLDLAMRDGSSDIPIDNQMQVVRANHLSCYGIHSSTEIAIPPTCPTLHVSMEVADRMLDLYKKSGLGGFVLSGRPGAGKSIATRCFAHKLMAIYGLFNPDDSIERFLDAHAMSQKKHMVLVIDEVDNDIDAMLSTDMTLVPSRSSKSPNPMNKKSWCALFDRLMFYPNVVVFATTNKPIQWLMDADAKKFDGALFRDGRFNHFIDFDNLNTKSPHASKKKNKRAEK
jgi:hypothetical protein